MAWSQEKFHEGHTIISLSGRKDKMPLLLTLCGTTVMHVWGMVIVLVYLNGEMRGPSIKKIE